MNDEPSPSAADEHFPSAPSEPSIASARIAGVRRRPLQVWGDARGRFMETFRKSWFPERSWAVVQTNCSISRARVLRGLHYHLRQVDVWFVPRGTIRVGLADLRRSSPTQGAAEVLELGEDTPYALYIPVGVAHGFLALTDAVLTYVVDNYHDGSDELGVAWNDPDLAVPWGATAPVLSPRDQQNPLRRDLEAHLIPD